MSEFQTLGLTAKIFDPLVAGGAWLYDLGAEVDGYTHTVAALGGFANASFRLVGRTVDIEEWLERGLGRHIEIWDADLTRVWEGFVNQIDLQQGILAYGAGPLVDLANRVLAVYDALNLNYNPPTQEGRTVTTLAQNTDSQARYGIWEKAVSAGKTTSADAGYVRDTFLAERAWPSRTQTATTGGGETSSVSISLLGYGAWLEAYTYSQTVSSGTTSAAAIIQAVLTADTNAIFSTDYSRLDANALLVPAYEADNVLASSKINEIVALGDASGNRWNFGFYEQRRAIYAAAPTTLAYIQSMQSQDQMIHTAAGALVRPWLVRPANWLLLNNFLVGKPLGASLATDLRAAYLETVTFTAPYQVAWTAGRLSRLDQIMAQYTMGGMR